MDGLLAHLNVDLPLPTIFELVFQQKLNPTFKNAFDYCFAALARQSTRILRLECHSLEIFHALWLIVECKFLFAYDATFAENFFGLRRRKLIPSANEQKLQPLSYGDKVYSVLTHVVFAYLNAKAEVLCEAASNADVEPLGGNQDSFRARVRRGYAWCLLVALPKLCAIFEAVTFLHYVAYLNDASPYYHPLLRLRRLVLCRLEAADLAGWQRQPSKMQFLKWSRLLLLLTFVGFKALEWWYSTEKRHAKALPVPPPPDPPTPITALPLDPTACPICHHRRTNPTLLSVSGYVFCFPCISAHLDTHPSCPVTGLTASKAAMRRLFETA
eukprot:EG_transcript_17807